MKDYVKENIELTEKQLKENSVKTEELLSLCGKDLATSLIKEAGGLKKLALMRPQTIYTLGSKRFFNSGMRKQEAGLIAAHKDFSKGGMDLAQKISIAARKDFFGKSI